MTKISKKKLYVWTNFCPSWTGGLAVAIASNETIARKKVIAAFYDINPSDWGDLKVYPLTKNVGFAVSGGD